MFILTITSKNILLVVFQGNLRISEAHEVFQGNLRTSEALEVFQIST